MSFSLSGGVEVYGFIAPTEITDEYQVIDPLYGIDGFRNVDTLNDLNNIPNLRRRAGMVVGIGGGTTYYKLNPGSWNGTISDWTLFQTGGGGAFTGGTVTGSTIFTNGLTANTLTVNGVSITGDTYTTGGTYSNGTIDFYYNTGGGYQVVGLYTGLTDNDRYVTGFTYQNNTFTIFDSSGNTFNATIDTVTGLTVNGNLLIGTIGDTGQRLQVSGKTKTTNLQVTSGATAGYVLTALDSSGNTQWVALGSNNNDLDPVLTITGTTPSVVNIGDRFLISGGTGIWLGRTNQIAEYTGVTPTDYSYYIPVIDDVVFVTDTLTTYRFDGTNWISWRGTAILQNGNSLSTAVNIGSNNNQNLTLRTSGQTRININTSGTTNILGTTNLVQAQGLNFLTFSSSTLANSGQTMYVRQTASDQYVFGSTGIGTFMRVGPNNVVNFEGQNVQSLNRGAQFGSSLSNPVQVPYAINIITLPSQSTGITANVDALRINPSITTTATYTGTYRGIYYNPTVSITTGTTHLAIETVIGDVIFGSTSGNVGIGTTTPTQRLQVSGNTLINGNLTATTISATTYSNLPLDIYVTGGTYNFTGDTLTLNRNDTSSIQITGFTYERQSDYVYPYFYGGSAPLYTLTSTATWIIKRVDYTTLGSPITLSAIGSWDNRYALIYT